MMFVNCFCKTRLLDNRIPKNDVQSHSQGTEIFGGAFRTWQNIYDEANFSKM